MTWIYVKCIWGIIDSAIPRTFTLFPVKFLYFIFSKSNRNCYYINRNNIKFTLRELMRCLVWLFFKGLWKEVNGAYRGPIPTIASLTVNSPTSANTSSKPSKPVLTTTKLYRQKYHQIVHTIQAWELLRPGWPGCDQI